MVPKKSKKWVVTLILGQEASRSYESGKWLPNKWRDMGHLERFEFETKAERDAFLKGAAAVHDWIEYSVKTEDPDRNVPKSE